MMNLEQTIAKTFLQMAEGLETGSFGARPKIALTGMGSEHGEENAMAAAVAAAKRGELEKADLATFPEKFGLVGWAPTQGHIPSGVPYIGFACDDILKGDVKRAMIIGKGSLFLGRMTNLFDGVSFVMQANTAAESAAAAGVSEDEVI